MEFEEKFEDLEDNPDLYMNENMVNRKSVIKGDSVEIKNPLKIEVDESDFEDIDRTLIEPIWENKNIVGVILKCSCGKEVEIQFEYES